MLRTALQTTLGLLLILGSSIAYAQSLAPSERYAPGVVLVQFAPDALPEIKPSLTAFDLAPSPAARQALTQARFTDGTKLFRDFMPQDTLSASKHGEPVHLEDLSRWYRLDVDPDTDIEALSEKLMASPGVLAASPDYFMQYDTAVFPDDPDFEADKQWGLYNFQTPGNDIHAPQAWELQTGRSDVIVAVMDSGVDYEHHDLDPGNRSRVIQGYDFADDDSDPDDCLGHGTSVAGVIGAITNNDQDVAGVMWNTRIMPLRVGDCSPLTNVRYSRVAEAFDYARVQGADIINLSLSFPNEHDNYNYRSVFVGPITNAWRSGILIVASAGNNGNDGNPFVEPPASYHMVMAVGATDRLDNRLGFSARGNSLDVVAPGTQHWSTVPGGGTAAFGGTSNAAPMTAGVAGLLLSESRDLGLGLTGDDLREIIRRTADDVNAVQYPGFDEFVGHGRVNAYEALRLVQAPNTVAHINRTGGTSTLTWGNHTHTFYRPEEGGPLAQAAYHGVRQYRVSGHVSFSQPYSAPPQVWAKMSRLKGWTVHNPNYQTPWINITNVTTSGFDYETYVYWVTSDTGGGQINAYFPSAPQNVDFGFTVVGRPAPPPPLSVGIGGPSTVPSGQTNTWTASINGGTPSYSKLWDYMYVCAGGGGDPGCGGSQPVCRSEGGDDAATPQPDRALPEGDPLSLGPTCGVWNGGGSGSALTRALSGGGTGLVDIRLRVTDAANTSKTATKRVTVSGSGRGTGEGVTESVESEAARAGVSLPATYTLDGAAPNPFRGTASVGFALPETAEIRLVVYDLLGREVAVLAEGAMEAGHHTARFDGTGLPSGVYVVRLTAGSFVGTKRMTLLR